MKYILLFYFCFISFCIVSQQKFSKEFSFVTDNDLYVSFDRDRYYTSGIFLNYRYLAKNNNKNLEKRIIEWQIGHQMYTPNNPTFIRIDMQDRPFAAYLYSSFGIKKVYKNNVILNTKLQLGIIGPEALGQNLQRFIHNIYGYKEPVGWKYQIKRALGLNLGTEYIYFLGKNKSNTFDVSWIGKGNLGTVHTDFSTGFNFRIGLIPLQGIDNSIGFNTNLNDDSTKDKRAIESFFYLKPMLRYTLYDATIQGSFLNTSSPVIKELVPFVFDVEVGFKFTLNRYNFGYIFNYNTSKSKGLRYTYGNKYGSIIMSYVLH